MCLHVLLRNKKNILRNQIIRNHKINLIPCINIFKIPDMYQCLKLKSLIKLISLLAFSLFLAACSLGFSEWIRIT